MFVLIVMRLPSIAVALPVFVLSDGRTMRSCPPVMLTSVFQPSMRVWEPELIFLAVIKPPLMLIVESPIIQVPSHSTVPPLILSGQLALPLVEIVVPVPEILPELILPSWI